MWADENEIFPPLRVCKIAYVHCRLIAGRQSEAARQAVLASGLSATGLSAACAVQVFILGVGLAEVHQSRVCLETRATCRTHREMQPQLSLKGVNLPRVTIHATVE